MTALNRHALELAEGRLESALDRLRSNVPVGADPVQWDLAVLEVGAAAKCLGQARDKAGYVRGAMAHGVDVVTALVEHEMGRGLVIVAHDHADQPR